MATRQIRLLLWKDYLIRKRKPVTLIGILWATCVMLSLYIVRTNIDNKDYPTCQFAARALPSAGVLNFLQSFICNVNNDCSPMDEFEEIPAYEKSRFSRLQREISPIINNASVVDVAASVPDALKLLATLADVADNPTFMNIAKNGLHVEDIFRNPKRVKRYLSNQLSLPDDVANSILTAKVGFQGIMEGNINRCSIESIEKTIRIKNAEHLTIFVNKLCVLPMEIVQNLVMKLVLEVDLGKYVIMIGEMYTKLSGDDRIVKVGNMVVAGLRMMSMDSFLPPELTEIIHGRKPDFSYTNLTMITNLMELFEPTFGETETYNSIKDFVDTAVVGVQYLDRVMAKGNISSEEDGTDIALPEKDDAFNITKALKRISQLFTNIGNTISQLNVNEMSTNIFNILPRIMNFILKWLPANVKHEVMFYSTLLGKLLEAGQKVININMNIEQWAYNVSLRNPLGIKVLLGLPPDVLSKGLEALTDAERTQLMTSKMDEPNEMFCDAGRIRNFFQVSKEQALTLKSQLCTDAWQRFTYDLISSFGIYDVKDNINSMASLFVLETLGRDISNELYSIDKDFEIMKNFTVAVTGMEDKVRPTIDWGSAFNISKESPLLEIFNKNAHLGKHMLITIHGALAKEVVRQNPLLEYKISPFIKNVVITIDAINEQLRVAPGDLQEKAKKLYPDVVQTILYTALDEEKSYKTLSTPCVNIFCNGLENASMYLNFPENTNTNTLVTTLCNITKAIEGGLNNDSVIGQAIAIMKSKKHSTLEEIDWTQLITGLNELYERLNTNYTYIFEYKSYGMDEELRRKVAETMGEVKDYWLDVRNVKRTLHLSVKLGLRFLDLLDHSIFNLTAEGWIKLKYHLASATGPIVVFDDVIQLIAGVSRNEGVSSNVPPTTAAAIQSVLPNVPALIMDAANIIVADATDVEPIISALNAVPAWPCGPSLTQTLQLSEGSLLAVRSLETLLCLDRSLQEEWASYLGERNVTLYKTHRWNTTTFPNNVFLRFSAAFDLLINDMDAIKDISQHAFDYEENSVTLISAVDYAVEAFKSGNRKEILSKFFTKMDTVLNSVNTSSIRDTVPLSTLWKEYLNCTSEEYIEEQCKLLGRAVWKNTFMFFSVACENIAEDLYTYFKESNDENANILQTLGFTKKTGLYTLYDKLPEFVAALINSYFDLGFMNQVRRASQTQFWDCEELISALNPGPYSVIDSATIAHVRPVVCPSFLHWVSMPKGDNSLIDVVTKPQYFFFTLEVPKLTSNYERAYTKANDLSELLVDISNKNKTVTQSMNITIIKEKLEHALNALLSYNINETDPSYVAFTENNRKQIATAIYLTKVISIINKIATNFDNTKITDIADPAIDTKALENELQILQKMFKRRPSEAIAFHFDLLTDVIWKNDENYKLTDALNEACDRVKSKDHTKDILVEIDRVKVQICAKKYEIFYGTNVQQIIDNDFNSTRQSLLNVVEMLRNNETENVDDIFKFFNERTKLVNSLKTSVKYAYDLGGVPIYLKYLQNNLQHYDVILTFVSGGDWWGELRRLYNGSRANKFFDTAERTFDIAEDILTHLDKIHLVRLLRDINLNSTAAFCAPNVTLSDYLPDGTGRTAGRGLLTALHRQLCDTDNSELFQELPPLLFASQGYDSKLKMSPEVAYNTIYATISNVETKQAFIKNGPKAPARPIWVTEDKLSQFKDVALQLLSKESLIKISFGALSNIVDAGTLFINSSQCSFCSQLTSWFKQLNLQLYKKQEYDNLLCSIDHMSTDEVHQTLKNDFHWDMAISELLSTRNYTKYELNKSLNELLELVKLQLLEDVSSRAAKLPACFASNVTGNALGNATLFAKVLSRTLKLLRSQLPHLQNIPGITDLPYFKRLQSAIAHRLEVKDSLTNYLIDAGAFSKALMKLVTDKDLVRNIESAEVNLLMIRDPEPSDDCLYVENYSWRDICQSYDCNRIVSVIGKHVNITLVGANLPRLQNEQFWQFDFVSTIMKHEEVIIDHLARLLGVVSGVDVEGVARGDVGSVLDTGLQLLMDDTLDSITYSILGLLQELEPIVHGTTLQFDVSALAAGLAVLRQYKNYFVEEDVRVNVSQIFRNPSRIEAALSGAGINNTNFWSVAAPRIQAGYILIKPLLSQKRGTYRLREFVCQLDGMSRVLFPGDVGVVTLDDVHSAVADQFCGVADDQVKRVVAVLVENINYDVIFDKLKSVLLSKLFTASNLTQAAGDTVLLQLGRMAELVPEVGGRLRLLGDSLQDEPLLKRMRKSAGVGDMLASSDFLTDAGNMMCGKPFYTDMGRFYKAIVQTKDHAAEPDPQQLAALPTEFCRDLYRDIISMDGGKIVWSFVKPLVTGRILYTPQTATVQKIIEKANATFAPTIKLINIIHSFADSFSSVHKLSQHRRGLAALGSVVSDPQYEQLKKKLLGDAQAPEVDVEELFGEFDDVEGLGTLLKKASDLLHCINLDRFKPMPDELELTLEAAKLSMVNEFSAGLVFMNISGNKKEFPTNIEYKIRMDIENTPTTTRVRNFMWIPGPEASFIENMRYFRGFVQIQDIIDKAIIDLSMDDGKKIQKREAVEKESKDWAIYTQQIPYPCYRRDYFQTSLYESQSTIVAFFFSLLFTVSSAVRFLVSDRETGNAMLMSVMGVNLSWHTLSWFVWSCLEMSVTVGCMTAVLSWGHILPRTDPSLILVLLFLYGLSVNTFCYMMSKMFVAASVAAVGGGIAYLVSFMPFVIILSLEAALVSSAKFIVSLSMSSSLCYAFLFITRFEAMGVGAHWSQLWESPDGTDDMNIAIAACMLVVDACLYLVVGMLLDRFFGIKSRNNVTSCQASGEKAGVSIVNVTKIYQEGSRRAKLALDNVSMELQKGQITTLLGHNGAGKTTLINILTGMLKPTKGHVIVRADSTHNADSADSARLGVCPQRDVLFDCLSAREHVALYAQLKSGLPLDQVQDEIDSMLSVMHLGAAGDIQASRLSGGTRRRLCVALAFVARPPLVSLDEPTAGVDPAARRDIWSMIMRLRAGRTILLTTHHLDEAELLSDQIIIMHKGQIHTTGSPIEIKRTLGSGYKLTVMYPDIKVHLPEETGVSEELAIEEKTKELLTATRSVIKNANLVDINGLEVEINLPFYDADGVSNNFLELCSTIEKQQETLGFRSYSMDCSSLEQVFFNICQQADAPPNHALEYTDSASKSGSSTSVKNDRAPLVPPAGPLRGSRYQQFCALLHARYLHYTRNRMLLFLVIGLPCIFIALAMGFSTIRPPANNEISLRLHAGLYEGSTEFIVRQPSIYSENIDPSLAQHVLDILGMEKKSRNWTSQDSPSCKCTDAMQVCDLEEKQTWERPQMMVLPDVPTLNSWLVDSQQDYIENRYSGYSSVLHRNKTHLVAWYNNKGYHALPAALNSLNTALLRAVTDNHAASISVYSHPLKISKEQINKDNVYQHVADAGISAMLLLAYSLASAGAAIYLVTSRRSQQARLQLLCGASPALRCAAALLWDLGVIAVNLVITAVILQIFHFPVFVARNNLPAICILILLYGYACATLVHLLERLFSEASLASMLLFCGNAFVGTVGITVLLILDIISDSDATDHVRWALHKVFLLSPQFALGDGLLEIAKNTIQAMVLSQFGMDTYRDPFTQNVVSYHYTALVLVGTLLLLLNLAIEYDYFEGIIDRWRANSNQTEDYKPEVAEVEAEEKRVLAAADHAAPLRLRTIGNINAGFVDTEDIEKDAKKGSLKLSPSCRGDAGACVRLRKAYGARCAVRGLTLGIPPGQCTALLGENGAGKSTTFSMLTAQVRPTAGHIMLQGRRAAARDLCQGLISYCPQTDAIDPLLTVKETLQLYCRLRGITDQEKVIRRTLATFELAKYGAVRAGALSGGNRRKVCAALAFMGRAPLVLLDEPTSGMDPLSRACVSRGVRGACLSGRAALLSTHALDDARRLAARVALLRAGELCALAPLDECLRRFGGGYVVSCRVRRGAAPDAWRHVVAAAPHASLRVLHHAALHFLLPVQATVDGKVISTSLSDAFRLLARLSRTCDIEDYTVNQSSLDQMFLNFTERTSILPSSELNSDEFGDELSSVTAL